MLKNAILALNKCKDMSNINKKTEQTICLDWLQFNFLGEFKPDFSQKYTKINENLVFKNNFRGGAHFRCSGSLIYHGIDLLSIEFEPRSPNILNPLTILVKLNNRELYQKGFISLVKEVSKQLNWQFQHIVKLDIAVDTIQKGCFKFIRQYMKGNIHFAGKTDLFVEMNNKGLPQLSKSGQDESLKYWRFGKRTSRKFMRGYYKKQEIEKSRKHYIYEFWKNNDLDYENNLVHRIELSIRKSELKRIKDFTFNELEQLEDPKVLGTIYKTLVDKYFQFVRMSQYLKQGCKLNRCKKFSPISKTLKNLAGELVAKLKTRVSNEIYRMKVSAKTLYFLYKKTAKKHFLQLTREIADNINENVWLTSSIERWNREFNLLKKNKVLEYIPNYTEYSNGHQIKLFKV